ncbi:hypothetical protein [Streptomyces longwoodensis]
MEVLTYRTHTRGAGIGPVGDSWRDAIGISGGAFGYAVAVFRWPDEDAS